MNWSYKEFLVQNYAKKICPLEENLKSFSFLLPGKSRNSSLIGELLYAFVSSVQLLHRRLIALHFSQGGKSSNQQDLERTSKLYRIAAFLLSVIKNFQSSAEMLICKLTTSNDASSSFSSKRSNLILLIELVKCALKMLLFLASGSRKPVPQRLLDDSFPQVLENRTKSRLEKGKLSGKLMTPPEGKVSEKLPPSPPTEAFTTKIQQFKEILHIFQPLIYILLIRKCGKMHGNGSASWKPWIAALGIFSFANWEHFASLALPDNFPCCTDKSEAKARTKDLLFFILKEPFYSAFIKGHLDEVCSSANASPFFMKPLIALLEEYQNLFSQYFYYTNK